MADTKTGRGGREMRGTASCWAMWRAKTSYTLSCIISTAAGEEGSAVSPYHTHSFIKHLARDDCQVLRASHEGSRQTSLPSRSTCSSEDSSETGHRHKTGMFCNRKYGRKVKKDEEEGATRAAGVFFGGLGANANLRAQKSTLLTSMDS